MVIDKDLKNLRHLTGANFLMADFGAAAEAKIDEESKALVLSLWRSAARDLLDAVGWSDSKIAMRVFEGGATLQISAPTDALYAATDLVEASWNATLAKLAGTAFDMEGTALVFQQHQLYDFYHLEFLHNTIPKIALVFYVKIDIYLLVVPSKHDYEKDWRLHSVGGVNLQYLDSFLFIYLFHYISFSFLYFELHFNFLF